ncbi:MAG: InlB B-repeat-containing protein [bacterium]|nr:InlB B-repeat-containing protein [bacterium]
MKIIRNMKVIRNFVLLIGSIVLIVCGKGITCKAGSSVKVTTVLELASNCASAGVSEIILQKDITISSTFLVRGTKKIVGNGHTLRRSASKTDKYQFDVTKGSSLEFSNITLDGANIVSKNGLILVEAGAKLKIVSGITIKNFKVSEGSAVITNSGTVTMTGGTITNNSTNSNGGALQNLKGGKATISGGTIKNNYAKLNGGGIYALSTGSVSLTGGSINTNSCGGKGNAIYAGNIKVSGKPTISSNNDVYIEKKDALVFGTYTGGAVAINFPSEATGTEIFTVTPPAISKVAWSKNYKNASLHPLTACTISGKKKICVGGFFNIIYKVDSIATCTEKQKKYKWGDTYASFPTVKRLGYTVTNWSTTSTNQTVVTSVKPKQPMYLTKDITLYPIYVPNTYQISFDANGGNKVSQVKKVTYNQAYGTFPTATRTGYTFKGWYSNKNGTTKYNEKDIVKITNNTVLYAMWTPKTYQLSFDSQGGSAVDTKKTVTYDSQFGTFPVPSRTGYRFEGWYSDKATTRQYKEKDTVKITSNTTLYAKWSPLSYQITFDSQGGIPITDTKNVTYASKFGKFPVPVRTGYQFCGWYDSVTGGKSYGEDDEVNITEDCTLYARWEIECYVISFDANGGTTSVKSKQVKFGEQLGKLQTPVRKGYIFSGWYTDKTTGVKYFENTIIKDGGIHTLYAHWIKNDVVRITVQGMNTTYFKGAKISTKGMILTAYYRDKTSKRITKGYKIKAYSTAAGKRNVTITFGNKSCKVSCAWYDEKQFKKIKLTQVKSSLYAGQTKKLKLSAKYDISNYVTYKSSNKKVATVNKQGLITAKKTGTVKITATVKINNHKRNLVYTLTVKKSELKIKYSYCSEITNLKFSAKTKGCMKKIVWSSSNTKVGIIDRNTGLFTAKNDGITYITAKSGSISRKIKVVVKKHSIQCI